MLYKYQIAGLELLCEIPFHFSIQEEASEFLSLTDIEEIGKKEYDAKVYFHSVRVLPEIPENAHLISDRYYSYTECGEEVHFCAAPGELPYACVRWRKGGCPVITCEYIEDQEWRLAYSRVISDCIGMETLFLKYKCLLMHASIIRWRGAGILFSAPSGTGKSTQAKLWEKYEQAEILNGDKAAVRKEAGVWYAYGLPYAGSSGIYRNEKAEVAAIVILRQANSNCIRQVRSTEAVRYLYPEMTIHQWDSAYVSAVMDILLDLIQEIPIYLLDCLPNQGAVNVLKQTIGGIV